MPVVFGTITKEDGTIPINLHHIELRPGNTCNLKCVTSNPISSSKWNEDFAKLRDKHKITFDLDTEGCTKEMFSWAKKDSFWEELINGSSELKQLFINGGEPTLMPEYHTFLQKLVSRLCRDTRQTVRIFLQSIFHMLQYIVDLSSARVHLVEWLSSI